MANPHHRDHDKEQFWRRTVQHWRRSGLSVRAFCAQHDLSEANFYAWRRVLAARDQDAGAAGRPAPAERRRERRAVPAAAPTAFVPVTVVPDRPAVVEVVLGRGRVVRVTAGFDPTLLVSVVQALEGGTC